MWRRAIAVAAAAALAGCGGDETVEGPPPAAPRTIELTSTAFAEGETIPRRYTCDGDDVSPPLAWKGVPARARALALVVEDPDAPGGTFVHWTLLDLPARSTGLGSGKRGYRGPCPPEGDAPHHYGFLLYALDAPLRLGDDVSPADARAAIARHAIAEGRLVGVFGR